jgi:uncharacterized protein (TIGR00255 family)
MTHSMTAFARQAADHSWGSLVWELRSVNHRYLEPAFKLPDSVRALEMELRERLRTRLARGKVECSLRLTRNAVEGTLRIDDGFLEQLLAATGTVKQRLGSSAPLDPLALLAWPGVLTQGESDGEAVNAAALALFDQALDQLIDTRAREGAALRRLLENHLNAVAAIVGRVRDAMPAILELQRQKLCDRLAELRDELNGDRVEQEMVILAQKADVEEELARLRTHVAEVRRTLKLSAPCGRRLDFLMQELNREANTLSSKSLTSDTTQSAVELKVLIEQMREQIQNIE